MESFLIADKKESQVSSLCEHRTVFVFVSAVMYLLCLSVLVLAEARAAFCINMLQVLSVSALSIFPGQIKKKESIPFIPRGVEG